MRNNFDARVGVREICRMRSPYSPSGEVERIRNAYRERSHAVPNNQYSIFLEHNLLMRQQIEKGIIGLLRKYGYLELGQAKILEVGCGGGFWLRQFVQWGAEPSNLYGIDLLQDRVDEGRKLCAPSISIRCDDASNLEFEDGTFDLVVQFTAFTSILDPMMRTRLAQEMSRVLKPNGAILWFDFLVSNPRNPNVRGVKRREIAQLFPGWKLALQRIVLAPPISRAVAPISSLLCRALSTFAPFCSHYLGWISRA